MKRFLAILLLLPLLLGCMASAETGETDNSSLLKNDLYVLFTSDVHSGVDCGWTYVGLESVRTRLKEAGYHVLLVDNGDSVSGMPLSTTTKGEANIELMNAMKYDVATVGNHEFDQGMEQFFHFTELADFKYVSCNFTREGKLCLDPYEIFEIDGAKVAFVGVTTPNTINTTRPKHFMDENGKQIYGFCEDRTGEALYKAVQSAVDSARAEGADYVVLLAHLGNKDNCSPWTYADVVSHTRGIDAVLDGHSHDLEGLVMKNETGEDVPRQGCGTKLEGIGYLKIATDGSLETGVWEWHNDRSAVELLGLENGISEELKKANSKLDKGMKNVIATTRYDLSITDPETGVRIVRNQETNIGDLCADAYLKISGADIAFLNSGAIRTSFPKGDISVNDALTEFPFGNYLCVCEATGQEILDALEFGARAWPQENGGWISPGASLRYEVHTYIDSSVVTDDTKLFQKVDGEYRVKNVKVNGEPLDLKKTYTVACTEYLLEDMGDGFTMFADNNFTQYCVMLDNQLLMTYLTENLGGVIGEEYAEPQGRITFVEKAPAPAASGKG